MLQTIALLFTTRKRLDVKRLDDEMLMQRYFEGDFYFAKQLLKLFNFSRSFRYRLIGIDMKIMDFRSVRIKM